MNMTDEVWSQGVKLAWQLAGDLAIQEKEPTIQPRHILFGIFSVDKLVNSQAWEHKLSLIHI